MVDFYYPPGFGLAVSRATVGWTREMAQEIGDGIRGDLGQRFKDYLKPRGRPKQQLAPKLREINDTASVIAKGALLASYYSRPNQRESYRAGVGRYAGGMLERALSSSENYLVKPTSFSFLNIGYMDDAAPQWYPMSFGWNTGATVEVRPATHPETGQILPSSPDLNEFTAVTAPFFLPGLAGAGKNQPLSWYIKKGNEIHVSLRSPGGRGRNRLRAPIGPLSIQPIGFVQEAVSSVNDYYPDALYDTILSFVDPDY